MAFFRTIFFLILAAVVAVALSAWIVFAPHRPPPDGPSAVGRADVSIRDGDGKPLTVTIWYPASGAAGGTIVENAPPNIRGRAPTILYAPGWGSTRMQSSSQTANLASHGFVVVACDDLSSDPLLDPEHGVTLDLSSDRAASETRARAGRHVNDQAQRLLAVLRALEHDQIPRLAGHLDLTRVGLLGYSIGGAAAVRAALLDPRIVAVMNVDGILFGDSGRQAVSNAYFIVSSSDAFPPPEKAASPDAFTRHYARWALQDQPLNAARTSTPGSGWVMLEGTSHADLSDGLYAFSRRRLFRTNRDRRKVGKALEALELAFFQVTLLDNPAPLASLRRHLDRPARWVDPHTVPKPDPSLPR